MQIQRVRGAQQKITTTENGITTTIIVTEGMGHHELIWKEGSNGSDSAKILGFNDDTLFFVYNGGCSKKFKSLKGARKQARKFIEA
jgi:hypothetical protein